jgi:hypothetical protein
MALCAFVARLGIGFGGEPNETTIVDPVAAGREREEG